MAINPTIEKNDKINVESYNNDNRSKIFDNGVFEGKFENDNLNKIVGQTENEDLNKITDKK